MSEDIQAVLDDWPYDPEKVCVRRIKGKDGRDKIQLRIEMGVLQMEIAGRPDGQRPNGRESLLHYYQDEASTAKQRGTRFALDSDSCVSLQMEALQYYHRRISFLELGEYERAQQDAQRNLDLFDFVKVYAEEDDDRMAMEQYRPFVIGHRVRASVLQSLEEERFDEALSEIDVGVEEIQTFFKSHDRPDLVEDSEEISFLREWAEEIRRDRPRSMSQDLREQLKQAVDIEDFERAAELRDRLRTLSEDS